MSPTPDSFVTRSPTLHVNHASQAGLLLSHKWFDTSLDYKVTLPTLHPQLR
jgi:hypothetical protein